MTGIGCYGLESSLQTQQIILPHESQHALVIDRIAAVLELCRYSPVPVARKFQSYLLNLVPQSHIFAIVRWTFLPSFQPFAVAASTYSKSRTGLRYRELKADRAANSPARSPLFP
jgi:hypothetical protein